MNETQMPFRLERQPQRTDLTLRPHHAEVMKGGYAALYYLSKRNFSQGELIGKIKGIFPFEDATREEKYKEFGGFKDVIGTTVTSYEEFVAKVVDLVGEIPTFSSRMPVTLKATMEDPICQACVVGSHCPAFRRDNNVLAVENRTVVDLSDPLGEAGRNTGFGHDSIRQTYEDEGVLAMRLPWGVLEKYYDMNENRYYGRYPERY